MVATPTPKRWNPTPTFTKGRAPAAVEPVLGPVGHGLREAHSVVGVGVDVVDLQSFQEQLETPGSTFNAPGVVFTARELRRAEARGDQKGDGTPVHLAAVWAMKEAALKAWLSAGEQSPLNDDGQIDWCELQVHHDAGGAPSIRPTGRLQQILATSGLAGAHWLVSASHDGPCVTAFAVLACA